MIALSVQFLAGRYHATGWDHQVNEGTVEWPPSPWRILRALVAASYRTNEPVPPTVAQSLLERLATGLPRYALPPASTGHVRHWMPSPVSKTRVFDAFVAVGDGAPNPAEVVISWPDVVLLPEERALLERLCRAVPYLGRAESWADVSVTDSVPTVNARPAEAGDPHVVTLLAPMTPEAYGAWRTGFVPTGSGRRRAEAPPSLWDALHAETGVLHKLGWSQAPGSRWVSYAFDREPFRVRRTARTSVNRKPADLAWFALDTPVRPRIERTVAIGDKLRAALMSRSDAHPVFSGKGSDGRPLVGHNHAHCLPTDADDDGFLDHVLVWAPGGFDEAAAKALRGLKALHGVGAFSLGVVLLNLGRREELGPVLGLGGRVWESRTPFVPPRHPKWAKGRDLPEEQAGWLAELAVGVRPISVEPLVEARGRPVAWHRFYRERKQGGGSRGTDRGYGFRMVFDRDIEGPLALGYGAHMGLGRFVPVR